MGNEKTRGDVEKMVARETELEMPKSAAQVKLRAAGSKVIEAFKRVAQERGKVVGETGK
jgi:hypothetical protein